MSNRVVSYSYDAVGNRVQQTLDGVTTSYAYDAANQLLSETSGATTTAYAYDANGRRTLKKLANGTRASFSYDDASNLTRLANLKSNGATISSFDYAYDKTGNRGWPVRRAGRGATG